MSLAWDNQPVKVPRATHAYLCSNGHYQEAPFELGVCQVFRKGKPCAGTLRAVGRGRKRTN